MMISVACCPGAQSFIQEHIDCNDLKCGVHINLLGKAELGFHLV